MMVLAPSVGLMRTATVTRDGGGPASVESSLTGEAIAGVEASGAWLSCVAGVPGIPSLPAAPLPFFKGEAARPRVEAGEARRLDPGALAAFVPPLPFNGEAARMIVDMESFLLAFRHRNSLLQRDLGQQKCSFKKIVFGAP